MKYFSCNRETIGKKALLGIAANLGARDITYGDVTGLKDLRVVAISKGAYGVSAALFADEGGALYFVSERTENLFKLI